MHRVLGIISSGLSIFAGELDLLSNPAFKQLTSLNQTQGLNLTLQTPELLVLTGTMRDL